MLQCGRLGAGHIPVVFAIIFFINLGCTYVFSVLRTDVDPLFPYVSAAGDHRPESCFFGLLLNISSFLSMLIIYLRFALVDTLYRNSDPFVDRMNFVSLCFGITGAAAMMIIANVQETAVIVVHLLAAVSCFGCGVIYMYMQSFLTVKMHPLYTNRRIGLIRSFIAVLSTVAFCSSVGFGWYAQHVFHKTYPSLPTPRPWTRKYWQPGYEFHVVSAISEWCMAVLNVCFLLSYSRDFEKIRVTMSTQSLVTHLDHSPIYRSMEDLDA